MRFTSAPPPSDEALLELLQKVSARIERVAKRFEEAFIETSDDALAPLLGAAVAGKSATPGERQGKPTSRLGIARFLHATPRDDAEIRSRFSVRWRGFRLHANTCVAQNDRQALQRLCRYTARGPVASDRLSDNTDHLSITPLKSLAVSNLAPSGC